MQKYCINVDYKSSMFDFSLVKLKNQTVVLVKSSILIAYALGFPLDDWVAQNNTAICAFIKIESLFKEDYTL